MSVIQTSLKALHLGQPQIFKNLAAIPLLNPNTRRPHYITLAQALAKGSARITEISEGGSVPELLLDNTGAQNVLILDGEELIGAKQNRIANLTILAAARSKTVLPVSCVEAGRWSYRSADFNLSERAQFARGRAAKAESLSMNMKATGTYGANQSQVWNEIADKQVRMNVRSETAAMADMYDQHHDSIEDYASQFHAVADQVGVLFAIDGVVEGMDLFDAPDTLAAMLPKLTRSFAIDALESPRRDEQHMATEPAARFLDRLAAANIDSYPGVGLGTDLRLSAPQVAGGALVHDEKLIHLVAFRRAESADPGAFRHTDDSAVRSGVNTTLSGRRYARMQERDLSRSRKEDGDNEDN
jgi:hypothetical protein